MSGEPGGASGTGGSGIEKQAAVEKSYQESPGASPIELKGGGSTTAEKSILKKKTTNGGGNKAENVPGEVVTPGQPVGKEPYRYEEPEFNQKTVSYPLIVLRTIAILAAIIIGIYLLFKLLLKAKGKVIADTDIIRVLATYPLSPNRVIQIVEIAEKVLVLGVTESNINLIMSVDDKEYADRIKLLSSKESAGGKGFKELFMKFIGGSAPARGGKISYLNNYKERIKKMKKF